MVYFCSGRNQCVKKTGTVLTRGLRKQATGFSHSDYANQKVDRLYVQLSVRLFNVATYTCSPGIHNN